MAETESISRDGAVGVVGGKKPRDENGRGLLLIGLFKYSKAVFFGALAAGALNLVHRSLGDLVMSVVDSLPLDPEGHFVSVVLDKADLISNHALRQAGMLSLGYAIVCVVEGTGLVMQKVWAEYFTVILTVAALPYEAFEVIHHFSWFKVGLTGLNVLVLLYLLWILKRKRKKEEQAACVGSSK
jgi:uncharacterized membrane protein (DUF2068 family)